MRPAPHSAPDPNAGSLSSDPPRADEAPRLTVRTASAEETQRVGEILGGLLRPGDLVLLQGSIGAGKTTFTQGVARGMGLDSRVTSPSFTLANVYQPRDRGFTLNHLDLWRIKSPAEALGIGLEEYLSDDAACLIEWPDVADTVFPAEHLRIRFTVDQDARELAITANGDRSTALLNDFGRALSDSRPMSGGARAPGD